MMKYIVLIGDGMADRPLKALGYRTCLQKARTPNMDYLAAHGEVGSALTIPEGFEPGSDVANLSILGYDPAKYYSGRAPIEAAFRKIRLGPHDIAFRCNLVTLSEPLSENTSDTMMVDYSAGHISTRQAVSLIRFLNKKIGNTYITFFPGVSYRHLMVWRNGEEKVLCTPPHDITGKKISHYLPKGAGQGMLVSLMRQSCEILPSHQVNKKRMKNGLRPANSIWLWGQGKKMVLPSFKSMYGLKGALISAVDLTKGLGVSAGFDILNVKGATGYIDTNYIGKARAALRALNKYDIIYVHVEAPDEAGHNGHIKSKIKAIEDFDEKVVGTVLKGITKFRRYRILLMPDHATPISVKSHTGEFVPFVIYSNEDRDRPATGHPSYSEYICRMKRIRRFSKGHELMDYFITGV